MPLTKISTRTKPIITFSPMDEEGEISSFIPKRREAEHTPQEDKSLVVNHLSQMETYFKDALDLELRRIADKYGDINPDIDFTQRPFRIDTAHARDDIERSRDIVNLRETANLIRKGGRGLYPNQIRTLIRSMLESTLCMSRPGIVLGPMQSGKTGLGLAHAMFLAPIIYSMTGVKLFPLFLSTNLTRNKNQTADELTASLRLYGNVDVVVTAAKTISVNSFYSDVLDMFRTRFSRANGWEQEQLAVEFSTAPTPKTYDSAILRDPDAKLYLPRSIDARELDIVEQRTTGRNVADIREKIDRAKSAGFSMLFLIDEPQFGASGKLVSTGKTDKFGREKNTGNVMRQIFADINDQLQNPNERHMAIGFSATPFDTAYHENFWVAPAVLSPNYIGPNIWDGEPIDPDVWNQPPNLTSLLEIEAATGDANISVIPALMGISRVRNTKKREEMIDHAAGRRAFRTLVKWMNSQREVVRDEIAGKRPDQIAALAEMMSRPSGGIARFTTGNGNSKSEFEGADQIIERLQLEKDFQVFKYYGDHNRHDNGEPMTGQEIIDAKYDPTDPRPPLFVPTAAMRMADNLPKIIEWGVDFSASEGDNNSNLQGIFGRLCGDSKFLSRLALGDKPASMLRDYLRHGRPVGKASAHSDIYGGSKRGRGTRLRKIDVDHKDPVMNEFIRRVNEQVVRQRFGAKLRSSLLQKSTPRYAAILDILRNTKADDGRNIIDYLNDPAVQDRYWPTTENSRLINPFDPADTLAHTDKDGRESKLHYDVDETGGFLVSFRLRPTEDRNSGHYGATNRGARRGNSQTDRVMNSQSGEKAALEMQINCRLVDQAGEELPLDAKGKYVGEGIPEAYMVTMALATEARGRYSPDERSVSLCKPDSWHNNCTPREELVKNEKEMARQAAHEAKLARRAAAQEG